MVLICLVIGFYNSSFYPSKFKFSSVDFSVYIINSHLGLNYALVAADVKQYVS